MSSLLRLNKKAKDRSGSVGSTGKLRSKSLENIMDHDSDQALTVGELVSSEEAWSELSQIKTQAPIVVCILPVTAQDLVASCLLSVGAYPLIPEDPEDLDTQLSNCKAVLVDVSARKVLLETFIDKFVPDLTPLVICATESGTNNHRKSIAKRLIDKCSPCVISGRLGDIHSLGTELVELAEGIIEEQDCAEKSPPDDDERRPISPNPKIKKTVNPRASPMCTRKKFEGKFQRLNTSLPQAVMKGQFRQQSMKDVPVQMVLQSGRNLAFHKNVQVHLYETNIVTCGEFFLEINNSQLGVENIHSTSQCAASIIAAVAACVDEEGGSFTLQNCGHALCMYHVAVEEAVADVLEENEMIHPGSLRSHLIDKLHVLDEPTVRFKAQLVIHNTPPN